jgi:Penicillin-insensitive murein endopeptidase
MRLPLVLTAILLVLATAAAASLPAKRERGPRMAEIGLPDMRGVETDIDRPPPRYERVRWRRSTPAGTYTAGRLIDGVRLPAEGRHFFTWDPVERHSPDRWWRRYGTDRLVRTVLGVAREYGAAHPGAARVGVGDLSRPRGGDFGIRFGPIGHASHQNGLDADVYYPRADGRERAPRFASEIDRGLSQELVDRFLARGAQVIFVGPNTGLTGPPGRVQVLVYHDNHLHVRLP